MAEGPGEPVMAGRHEATDHTLDIGGGGQPGAGLLQSTPGRLALWLALKVVSPPPPAVDNVPAAHAATNVLSGVRTMQYSCPPLLSRHRPIVWTQMFYQKLPGSQEAPHSAGQVQESGA